MLVFPAAAVDDTMGFGKSWTLSQGQCVSHRCDLDPHFGSNLDRVCADRLAGIDRVALAGASKQLGRVVRGITRPNNPRAGGDGLRHYRPVVLSTRPR